MDKQYNSANTFLAFVDDNNLRDVLKELPYKDIGLTEKILKGQTQEAIDYLRENESPRIILVDISKSDLPLTDLKSIIEVCAPTIDLVVIGEKNDVGLFREILALGAKDYIVKPLRKDLIIRKLKEIVMGESSGDAPASITHAGQLIAFVGSRGGVGTSTFASNCAWTISQKYHKYVGLVDLDFKTGGVSYFFNLPQSPNFADTIVEEKHLDINIIENLVVRHDKRLGILSARDRLIDFNSVPLDSLGIVINIFKEQYNYSIVDLPSKPNREFLLAIADHANVVVLMTDLTLFSIAETSWILDELRDAANFKQKVLVVVNRYGEYKEGYLAPEDFETAIGHKIDFMANFDNKSTLLALNDGVPVASGEGLLASDIHKFTEYLLEGKVTEKDDSPFKQFLGMFSSDAEDEKN